jgi:hypothetical protein
MAGDSIAAELLAGSEQRLEGKSIAAELFDTMKREEEITSSMQLRANAARDPARQAEALRISHRERLPLDTVYRNLERLKNEASPAAMMFGEDTPTSKRMASDPKHGPVVLGDVESMTGIEKMFRSYVQDFNTGIKSTERDTLAFKVMFGSASRNDRIKLAQLNEELRNQTDYGLNFAQKLPGYAIQSAPQMAITVGRTWDEALIGGGAGVAIASPSLAAGPQVGLPVMAASGITGLARGATAGYVKENFQLLAGNAFAEAMDTLDADGNPLGEDVARSIGYMAGGVNALVDILPMDKFLRTVPLVDNIIKKGSSEALVKLAIANPAGRAALSRIGRLLKVGVAESAAEVMQEIVQLESIMAAGGEYDASGNALAAQRGDRYFEAAVGGFAAGTAFGAAGEGVSAGVGKVRDVIVKRSEERQQRLLQLAEGITKSKTQQISPETVAEFARRLEAEGGAPAMSAPAEAVLKLFQGSGIDPDQAQSEYPGIAKALYEARETGAEVALPAADLAKLSQLQGFEAFSADVRTGPDEMTVNEAKEMGEAFDQAAAQIEAGEEIEEETIDPITEPGEWRSVAVKVTDDQGAEVDVPAGDLADQLLRRREAVSQFMRCMNAA